MSEVTLQATKFAEANDTDILLYSGSIERPYDDKLLDWLSSMKRRENVLLLLCTHGGDPDAAYRMARGLQNAYSKFTVVLAGPCKSAGTLIVLGAHEIVMTDHAELGPLDVQLGKKDELFELDSGLTVLKALEEIEGKAFELFERAMIRIKLRSQGSVTLKTATHIATELAKGLVAPIMAQIDPMHIGEVSRALKIGNQYGERLSECSKNLQALSLKRLVEDYPSHGFVIDRKEAQELFLNVRDTTTDELALLKLHPLRGAVRRPSNDEPTLGFISEKLGFISEKKEDGNVDRDAQDGSQGDAPVAGGDSPDEAFGGSQESAGSGSIAGVAASEHTGTV